MAPRPVVLQIALPGDLVREFIPDWLAFRRDPFAFARDSALMPGWLEFLVTRASAHWAHLQDVALSGRYPAIGANLPYDLAVLAEHPWSISDHDADDLAERRHAERARAWSILDRGQGHDVQMRERLIDIARGMHAPHVKYNLGAVAERYRVVADKENPWRKRFAELEHVPIASWPTDALEYALGDVAAPAVIFEGQRARGQRLSDELGGDIFADEPARIRAAWGLHLDAAHGMYTDPAVVHVYHDDVETRQAKARHVLLREGLMYLDKKDGKYHKRTKIMRARVVGLWHARGVQDYPTTDSGKFPELSEEVADALADSILHAWVDWGTASSASGRLAEVVEGQTAPVHTTFDVAASGRSRSFDCNLQNRPTKGPDRECFAPRVVMPRRGGRPVRTVYLDTDHDGLELDTVAQCVRWIVGYSRLGESLVAKRDVHMEVGAGLMGISYDEARARRKGGDKLVDENRQTGKVANFSFAGGGGAERTAREAAVKYGVVLPVERWKEVKRTWLGTYTEFAEYFRIASAATKSGCATIRQFISGRFRGGLIYTEWCNGWFQALGADLTADVLYELQRACYVERWHPLYGCRTENYVHDQYLLAVPLDEHLDARAAAKQELVQGIAQRWLPDQRPTATPIACARWSKRAREVRDEAGRLHVWDYDPLIEAVWRVGSSPEDKRGKIVEGLGPVGTAAGRVADELEREADRAGADRYMALRALDARACDEVLGYGQGPAVERQLELARVAVEAVASVASSALCA
jgi:hypothetical protein